MKTILLSILMLFALITFGQTPSNTQQITQAQSQLVIQNGVILGGNMTGITSAMTQEETLTFMRTLLNQPTLTIVYDGGMGTPPPVPYCIWRMENKGIASANMTDGIKKDCVPACEDCFCYITY